jgi:16S rRNA (adenine1518-N6/adenine1519-N6)-dimethyltransferase
VSRQRLGQHFLTSASCQRIVRAIFGLAAAAPADGKTLSAENRSGDVWIEIGAGHGEMTELLAQHARRVVAIEIDERLLPRLRQVAARLGNVSVVAGDVLALDLGELAAGQRFRVYGNLPYYITSPIVHRLLEHADRLDAAFLLMQLEVAERLAAKPGHREYAYLSAIVQFHAQVQIMLRIPPGAFRPPPKVGSALVALRPPGERPALGISDEHAFGEFLKRCFAQKRKTLRNNLRGLVDGENVEEIFPAAGIALNARAEELTLAQFARLFELTATQRRSA